MIENHRLRVSKITSHLLVSISRNLYLCLLSFQIPAHKLKHPVPILCPAHQLCLHMGRACHCKTFLFAPAGVIELLHHLKGNKPVLLSLIHILTDYKRILFQISTDVTCMDNILELSKVSPDSAEYRRISESLETYIKANILMYPEIQALCVISTTGTPYIYVQKRQKTQPIIDYFEANKEELNQLLLSSTRSIIGSVHDGSPYYDPEHPVFFLGSRTIHYEKMKITGSILLFISPDKMNSAINNPDSQVYPFTDKLLVDSSGRLILSLIHI